ncbi:SH3 and multiple ankyrin repeat domains protein 1-like [Hemiscyllium ocellatum]|uniref:SH3 and multiple ankyrin repeat domains protein 1-like n=1 Tax=Hemiscyllium ocellatum TaxID=170820 RepID=UPI00296711AD|nr:SH3 and multiple ankyrin repeat domains protein 1-like [Hemiscyllium ocellatum]
MNPYHQLITDLASVTLIPIADDSMLGAVAPKAPLSSTFQNWPKTPQHSPKPPKTVEFDIKPPMRRAPSPSMPQATEHRVNPGTPRPSSLPILPSVAQPGPPMGYDIHSAPTSVGNSFASFPPGSRAHSPTSSFQSPPPVPPDKPFAAKPLAFWTKFDVADWLDYLNLGEHKEHFLDNEIDGSHLPSLQRDDYVDLGVTRVGHRMNIERALKRLLER